ncbi:MAG: hypothetical protein LBK56_04355 [Gracilibacteraceae bacterium]|jgi:hypothetical protein|nr:hypothetical protein [Gracilibacteraceae bacterium]
MRKTTRAPLFWLLLLIVFTLSACAEAPVSPPAAVMTAPDLSGPETDGPGEGAPENAAAPEAGAGGEDPAEAPTASAEGTEETEPPEENPAQTPATENPAGSPTETAGPEAPTGGASPEQPPATETPATETPPAETVAETPATEAPPAESPAVSPEPPAAALAEGAAARMLTDAAALTAALNQTAAYVYGAVPRPQVGSVGGEWAVIGLARSGYAVPDSYYETYYQTVADYLRERGGILHAKKYTEYSRVILGLTAAGYDARDAGGYDLTLPLADFDQTVWQGINGPVWALIALDSADYPLAADDPGAATRQRYIAEILRRQLPDGGFNLTAGAGGAPVPADARAEVDITGMALQALAGYREQPQVRAAADKALACLAAMQDDSGGFAYRGETNLESGVQVLTALTALGLSVDDPRFVKNERTILSNILSFSVGDGSFRHSAGGGSDLMSTEQALYAMAAARRSLSGQSGLYRMSDAVQRRGGGA